MMKFNIKLYDTFCTLNGNNRSKAIKKALNANKTVNKIIEEIK